MSDHEIPLAIGLLEGISCVLLHYNTGLLLFNRISSNYWAVIPGEKIQVFLLINKCKKYIKGILFISDHEIPLAIGLLKGIPCVLLHVNTGLLSFNRISSNYWAVIPDEKNTAFLTS
jgi:hypothetical protein